MTLYLKGLNGLRAIAAIAVLFSHATLALNEFGLRNDLFGYLKNGELRTLDFAGYGVSIFFVLSGFLITFLLLKENKEKGINLKKFYARRALRIWPLYYFYLAVVLCVLYFFGVYFEAIDLFFYLFLSANIAFIFNNTIPYLVHYWSLGVEEQFYIFWPVLVKRSQQRLLSISIASIIFLVSLKTLLHLYFPGSLLELIIHVSRFHCMLMGGVGAILYFSKNQLFFAFCKNRLVQMIAWLIYAIAFVNKFNIASFLDNEFISLVTVVIIVGQITESSVINLEKKWLNFIGIISFGLYVYHPLIIFLLGKVIEFESPSVFAYLLTYSVILFTTITVSYTSHRYLESYFIRLKNRRFTNL